jgi:hypothetical protein
MSDTKFFGILSHQKQLMLMSALSTVGALVWCVAAFVGLG